MDHRLREDLFMQCRLCSSKSTLISLFKGKNKQIRNYIRKLIEITIGIKCEEHDYFGCICYNCVVHVYNMYVFRTKSLLNEEKLQDLVADKVSDQSKRKKPIKQLKDIKLIEYNDLICMIKNWMQNKLENYSSSSTLSSKNSTQENNSEPLITSLDCYTQTEPPHQHSVSIQTICKAAVTTIYTQTEQSTQNKSTQYEINKLANKSVNCNIQEKKPDNPPKEMINKSTQCDSGTILAKQPNEHSDCVHNKINNIVKNSNDEKLENQAALCLQFTVPDKHLPKGIDKSNCSLKESKLNNKLNGIIHPLSINCSLEATGSEFPSNLNISPVPSIHLSTPRAASELLEITKEVLHLHNCKECDLVMYSKEEVQNHKKNHMKCNLCQKKFRTIEKTKEHYEVCKQINGLNQPYVALERFKVPKELEKSSDTPPKKKSKTMPVELSKKNKRK